MSEGKNLFQVGAETAAPSVRSLDPQRGIKAIAHYLEMRRRKPLIGLSDTVHRIHTSTDFEAEITLADLERAVNNHHALVKALELALLWLGPREPPDSRAVSDEYVAMAAIHAGIGDANCVAIIDAALQNARA